MDINKKAIDSDPYFEEVKLKTNISFDFVLWFYRILKYWYLFLISVIIFMSYAYLKNKSWVPVYGIQSMIILEDRGTSSVLSGSVPLGSILRNTENQQILLQSYGLVERTVEKLPKKMHIDYFIQTRFKTISQYTDRPVEVVIDSLQTDLKPEAYRYTYNITYVDENQCRISYKENPESEEEVSFNASFDQEINNKLFKIKLRKTSNFKPDFLPFNVRFFTNNQLLDTYNGRITTDLKSETSTAITLSMYGTDPAKDIDFMTALLNEFRNYNLTLKNEQADLTIDFLEVHINVKNDSLNTSRLKLEKFQRETGVYEISSNQLRAELNGADTDRDILAVQEKAMLIVADKVIPNIKGNTELIDPASLGLEGAAAARLSGYIRGYNEIIVKAKNLGPKSPLYNTTINELNELRMKILKEIQVSKKALQDQKNILIKKYQTLDDKLENLPPQERDLVKFQREYDVNQMYHQFLTQRQYEAKIQKASNTPDNFIWEWPRMVGGAVNGGEINKNYMYFFLVSLIIPLAFVIFKEEIINFAIMTKEDCEKISGLPVIGTIENISKKLNNGVVLVKNYPKSSFAESFRNMRVRIEYMAQRENKITVLVTSTEPADGKTFIATNVASVYQLMGKKVVIVDLDLRRPSVGKTLQIEAQKGISNYLIGQVELEDIIISHPDYGFDIIPAGTLPPNPSELIKTAKTKQVLEHLKETYDYVIIDCSPVGLVSDAYILSSIADTTLFVVRRAKTNKSFFKSVINQLKYDGVENIALVFNDVKGREGYYGTSRYYGDKTYYLKKNSYYHDDYFEN
jgi:capsular exopolysaccharide synthesis family protein